MRTARLALSASTILLLVAGYLASQYAYFNGQAPAYAAKVDEPPFRYLALLLFLAALVFAFIPDRSEDPS